MRAWMVRLGKFGEQEDHALKAGELITGWTVEDLTSAETRDEIRGLLKQSYPDQKQGTLQNWAIQLNQFIHQIEPDDLVIVPLKTTGNIAVGKFIDSYVHSEGGHPARKVEWLTTELPRTAMKQDLLYSIGATQTVCQISRNEAAWRFLHAAEHGKDPGPSHMPDKSAEESEADSVTDDDEAPLDLEQIARDQIERHVSANFAGHRFTRLIGAILEAQGYRARVSPSGPDRGIDIVAGKGALGLEGPRLVVQVKSGDIIADQPTLQSLIGCVQDTQADQGLLVSWSGFKSSVRQRINELYFRVRLWGRDEILNAIFSVYDKLPEEIRADLPLQRIWSLVQEND